MTKQKSTKRALLMSALSLLMCISMLIGSTFAWFTDSVTSSGNKIQAGTLKIDLELLEKNEDGSTKWTSLKDSKAPIFNYDKWEPGYTDVKILKVENEGTLALKWIAKFVSASDLTALANVIDVYVKPSADEFGYATDRTDLSGWENVGTVAQFVNTISETTHGNLKGGEKAYLGIALKMQESADNTYQGMDLGGAFDIQILATQLTSEFDSFDDQYDVNAPYGTYIELNAGDNLLAAMASAEADMPLTIKLKGNVEWPTEGHHGENDVTPASSILIDGNGYTITATGSGVTPLGDKEAPMTLKNIKIVDNSVSYTEGSWEFTYLEMGGTKLICDNVTFADEIQPGTDAIFTNCSFESNEESVYAVWVEAGSATFTNCTFTGYRGLKMHEDYGSEISSVAVKGCTFTNISKKPGIAIGDLNADTTVSVTGSTFINCQAGDQGKYIYETDTDVTTFNFVDENNTVLNNISEVVEIATKADLFAFAQRVNNGDSMSKKLVVLTADIDLENELWIPIGQTGATQFTGIFDGQGHTIKNLNVDSSAQTGEHYSSGLFGWVEGKVTIKNVSIDGATVKGNHNVAALLGYTYSAQISNCHVSNTTIVCKHANGDACGDKAGTIVGYAGDESRFTNCSASDSTVTAGRDAGQVIGTGYNVSVSNCNATNVTVSATGDCNREGNINNAIIGRVMG